MDYNLSKRTKLYADYGSISQDNGSAIGISYIANTNNAGAGLGATRLRYRCSAQVLIQARLIRLKTDATASVFNQCDAKAGRTLVIRCGTPGRAGRRAGRSIAVARERRSQD